MYPRKDTVLVFIGLFTLFVNESISKALAYDDLHFPISRSEQRQPSDSNEFQDEADLSYGKAWAVTIENDLFVGDDDGLTNAIAFQLGHGTFEYFTRESVPSWLLPWIQNSYINREGDRSRGVVYVFGQAIQTPTDISTREPIEDDLPYVGLLISSATFYSAGLRESDRLGLWGGIVGPLAFAEQSQRIVHRITGSEIPQGWDNQIGNEPVFMLDLGKIWRLSNKQISRTIETDVLLLADLNLGNFRSAISTSGIIRFGRNLVGSYPLASVLPDRQISPLAFSNAPTWYVFSGVQASYVANDIFVNGNTFRDSNSFNLDHTQSRVSLGLSLSRGRWAYTALVSELASTSDADPFGSFSVTYRYR